MDSSGLEVWFQGTQGRDESQPRFLAAVRNNAQDWRLPGFAAAESTLAHDWAVPLALELEVPGLQTCPRDVLEVAYQDARAGAVLSASWGEGAHPLDGPAPDEYEDLEVMGVVAPPEDFARWASDWMLKQLQRPVVREDWLHGALVVATTWRLADTRRVLARTGISLRRRRGRPAGRTTRLR